MPAKAVTTQFDTILTAEVSDFVGLLPVPLTLLRMQLTGLHIVLSRDAAELSLHQINLVVVTHITLVQGYTNQEIVLVSVFQFNTWIWVLGSSPLCLTANG